MQSATLRIPWILFWITSISMLGCQTSRSWEKGCPGVYSGVRYYRDQRDGLPITIAADTALLPVSVFMKPKRPRGGFASGCRWVLRR